MCRGLFCFSCVSRSKFAYTHAWWGRNLFCFVFHRVVGKIDMDTGDGCREKKHESVEPRKKKKSLPLYGIYLYTYVYVQIENMHLGVQHRFILHQPFSVNRSFPSFSPKRLNLRVVSLFFFFSPPPLTSPRRERNGRRLQQRSRARSDSAAAFYYKISTINRQIRA